MSAELGELTVVIVHYRTPDLLESCLRSLSPYLSRGVRVAVVDNASGELAPGALPDAFPGVELHAQPRNLGYAKAVNAGLSLVRGRFALVLNPDIVVRDGSLEALLLTAGEHPEAGIVAPMLLNPDGTLQHSCRRFYDLKTLLYRRTPLGRLPGGAAVVERHLMTDYDHARTRVVDWVLGGAMLVRMRAVEDVGPMDERFFLYFEDVDWCYQMHRRGWRVVYEPAAEMVHHHRRESAKRPLGKSFFSHAASVFRFYEKWSLVIYILKSRRREIGRALRIVTDLLAINLAFFVAYLLRMALGEVLEKPVFRPQSYRSFWIFGNLVTMGGFYVLGLYRRERRDWDWVDRLFAVGRATGIVTVVMMATTFLLYTQSYSRAMVILFWPLATATVLAGRQFARVVATGVREWSIDLPRVAIVGSAHASEGLRRSLADRKRRDLEPIFLSAAGEAEDASLDDRFMEMVRGDRIAAVYFMSPEEDAERLARLVPRLGRAGVAVYVRPVFAPILDPDARVEDVAGSWAISLGTTHRWHVHGFAKRTLDVIGSISLILLLAPVNAAFALSRRARGRGPVTVLEERFVQKGTPIRQRMYQPRPRGNLFQIVCIDPYPRLFSVLAGRASFVGVHPFRREEIDALPPSLASVSLDARPGLTGLWWFHRGERLSPERLRALDVEYVQRWSNGFDLRTFIRAFVALVATRGHLPERRSALEDPA